MYITPFCWERQKTHARAGRHSQSASHVTPGMRHSGTSRNPFWRNTDARIGGTTMAERLHVTQHVAGSVPAIIRKNS